MKQFIIDVSTHQKEIDWLKAKNQGVQGAILRVGYTGWGSLESYIDAYFEQNYKGANDVNLPIGVYFYSVAITEQEAINEAKFTLELLKGRKLDMPIFFDTEEQNRTPENQSNIGKTRLTKVTRAFCDYILNNSKYQVGVYASKSWFENKLNYNDIAEYMIWVAQYNDVCTFKQHYDIWQYSSTVVLDGVSGHSGMVDANWLYTERENDMPLKIVAIKQKLAIRETMAFTTKKVVDYDPFTNKTVARKRPSATGKIMHILDIGQSVDIIAPMPGIAKDGWQWFSVNYNGKTGYCQYDSMAYSIEPM